jgi:class 3 adenylate cyclase
MSFAEEHDIFGDGLNIAAHLEALAEPGGICVSRVAATSGYRQALLRRRLRGLC